MSSKKVLANLKEFYDTHGWKKDKNSRRYHDQLLHTDIDETSQKYMLRNEDRYKVNFENGGQCFLDAGCGAAPRQNFSRNFEKHVCVDISITGLAEAGKKLGDKGIYLIADLADLPFKDETFDGVLASHCLYHVHNDLQPVVLKELYRVTKSNKNLVVFYSSNYNLLSLIRMTVKMLLKFFLLFYRLRQRIIKIRQRKKATPPPLYYYTHNPFKLAKEFNSVEITCLRILTMQETKILKKLRLLKLTLPVFAYFERTFPRLMSYIGRYVVINVKKLSL